MCSGKLAIVELMDSNKKVFNLFFFCHDFRGAVLIGPSLQIDPEQATPMKMGAAKLLGSIVPWLPLGHLDMKDLSRNLEAVKKQGPDSKVF